MAAKPYHLCFVNSMRSFGGAEVWFLAAARTLHEAGLRVSLIAQPDAVWLDRARAIGITVKTLSIRVDGAPWTAARLARWFASHGVTAVIANTTKDLKNAALAGRLARLPVILGTRESDFPLKDNWNYRLFFRHLATGLLVNSEATRRTTLGSAPWLDPDRVHLLYKGIDPGRFRPAETPPPRVTVGFVGQFIERKGVPELMQAWSRLEAVPWAGEGPPPVLRMAGEGVLGEDLARWRQGLRHPGRVEIMGFVEDIPAFYRECSLLVMPSHAEGFGLAAAEAAVCGLPVIAGRASSLPEIVQDGVTGRLVDPGDVAALLAAIEELAGSPPLRARWGRAGRRRVLDNFTHDRCMARLIQLTGGPVPAALEGALR